MKLISLVILSLMAFTFFVFGAETMREWVTNNSISLITEVMQLPYALLYLFVYLKQDKSIADVVYSTSWYQQSVSFKKLTLQFLLLLSKPLEMRALGTYTVGYTFLMKIFRNLYSGLNLMMATLDNN